MSKLNERLFEKKVYKIATYIIGEENTNKEFEDFFLIKTKKEKGKIKIVPDFCGRVFEYKDKTKFIKFWKKFFSAKRDEAIEKLGKKKLNIWWRLKPEVDSWRDWETKKIIYACYGRFVIL